MRTWIDPHLRLLLARLGPVLLLFTLLRWLFFALQHNAFAGLGAHEALTVGLQGLRFDLMTIVLANGLFIVLHLFPFGWRDRPGFQRGLFVLFMLVNVALLLLCCIDLVYFGFSNKRIGRDMLGQTNAGLRMLPSFLVHYWWATLAFAGCVIVLWKGYRRWRPMTTAASRKHQWLTLPLPLFLILIIGRGGWQYQGLSPAHAADHVDPRFAPLVTNSAFTFLYSLQSPEVEARHYFSEAELEQRFPLALNIHRDPADRRMNVVLLIVESLGREYIAPLSGAASYMPFLDSLSRHALVYTNAFANAERSNKSMCAILAGIPSLTDDAFMNTAYADDRVEGLGTRMKEMGYSTAFFHGGLNGEYKFDSFSKACGFDRYFGKDEFGNDEAYDGHWGVYDEEFLQFVAGELNHLPAPFCAVEFTLSSHDPFPVPPKYKGRFPKGTQEIHESLGYADLSIRHFFDRIKQEPWYTNTLFVITGDHTFLYNDHPLWFRNPAGRFAVPIMLLAGDGSVQGRDSLVAQHMDILPTVLDRVGYEGTISAFGQSLQHRTRPGCAVQRSGSEFRYLDKDRILLFDGTRSLGLYAYDRDTLFAHDLLLNEPDRAHELEERAKAVIQRHASALRDNALVRGR